MENNYIRPISHYAITPFLENAVLEGILFSKKCDYYGFFIGYNIIGFCGMIIKGNKAILKCDYILPQHRKNGYLMQMINHRKVVLKIHYPLVTIIEANCTKMALNAHLNSGAKIVKVYKNGITQVRYENI